MGRNNCKNKSCTVGGAKGLRLAIIPAKYEKSDKIYFHETKNLIVCPLP